jgi:hypothetical protein
MTTFMDLPLLVEKVLFRRCFEQGTMWIGQPTTVEMFDELQTFFHLQSVSAAHKRMLSGTTWHAAIRLANIDLENVVGWNWINNDPKSFITSCFRENLELLRQSRKLVVHVSPGIVAAPLGNLTTANL